MDANVECLGCNEVEDFGYFQLLVMRYDDRNVVTESHTNSINLNSCRNFRTCYRVPQEKLRLSQHLIQNS